MRQQPQPEDPLAQLLGRPGFLIRRAHQISVAVFMDHAKELGITPTQFGILQLLKHRPSIDQITVAKLLGLDRSTTAMVVTKLVESGLVDRAVGKQDRRRRHLELTPAGSAVYDKLQEPAESSRTELLSVFKPEDAERFLALLRHFTSSFAGSGPSQESEPRQAQQSARSPRRQSGQAP